MSVTIVGWVKTAIATALINDLFESFFYVVLEKVSFVNMSHQ